ncbi:integrase catalytic domain-containing protein [Trichonephila clavipes]|nr:integrase catalytic domain-containing protein [Trichonephila clavipes]
MQVPCVTKSMSREIAKDIHAHSRDQWEKHIEALSPVDNTLWRKSSLLRKPFQSIPPLKGALGSIAITPIEKVGRELFDVVGRQLFDQRILDEVTNFINTPHARVQEIEPTTPTEVLSYVQRLEPRKSPGLDQISNRMIKNLPLKFLLFITLLIYIYINQLFKNNYFPNSWKTAVVIPILKPEKDSALPSNYRPISLLTCLSKVYEFVLLQRLNQHCAAANFIIPQQCGFRPKCSTVHQLLRVTELIDVPQTDLSHLAMFADDTAIITQNKRFSVVISNLQHYISLLELCLTDWKVKVTASKSACLMFTRRPRLPVGLTPVQIFGQPVPWRKISNLWELDSLAIKDPIEKKSKLELQDLSLKHFENTVLRDDEGRYIVSIPWIEGNDKLEDYYSFATGILEKTVKTLKFTGRLFDYEQVFVDWEKEGIIEKITQNEPKNGGKFHYLPHRPVFKENSMTKIRPVFDGSAHHGKSCSLNDCVEKEPNLIERIPAILNSFHVRKIGVISDIRKAFLQIYLHQNDMNFLRFFWWEGGNSEKAVIYRHHRVVFDVSCSPFLLAAVLNNHFKQANEHLEKVAEKLKDSIPLTYVTDDVEDLEPLTSAMFLQDIREVGVPELDQIDENKLNKILVYRNRIQKDHRKRFRVEYLGQLREIRNIKGENTLSEGDIVLVGDEHSKRLNWNLDKILKLYPGKDKKVRVAQVKTKFGSFLRPVQKLYLLKVMEKNKSSVHPINSLLFSDANEGSHLFININPELSTPQRAATSSIQPCSSISNGGAGLEPRAETSRHQQAETSSMQPCSIVSVPERSRDLRPLNCQRS